MWCIPYLMAFTLAAEASATRPADLGAMLQHQRAEEQLAGDLYTALAERWVLRQFEHIAEAERRHAAAVGRLLSARGLDDPTRDRAAGDFADPAVQRLYDRLLEQGLASAEGALRAGAEVEELDIADLDRLLEAVADEQTRGVLLVLRSGSHRHLRAFVRGLDRRGVTYEPLHLSPERYKAAVEAGDERGGGRGPGGRCGRGGPAR